MIGKRHMFASHAKFHLFFICNLIYTFLRDIYWWISGRSAEIKEAQANYATSGHKMGIAYKHILDLLFFLGKRNFVLYHEEYVHPEYVLQDHITLLHVTHTEAVFVEAKKGMEPAYSSTYSFFFNGQFLTANKIISMPLKSFYRLADEMKGDGGKIIFVHNQARCGSTLMTSIFEHTGRCLAFAEPHALNSVCKQIAMEKCWSDEEGKRLLRATVLMICKPYRSLPDKVLAYVIKPTASSIACAANISDAVPEASNVFIYRDPISVGQSLRRLGEVLQSLKMTYFLMECGVPNSLYTCLSIIGLVTTRFRGWTPKNRTGLEFGYKLAMITLAYREELTKKGLKIPAIRFEDLRAEPKPMITKIVQTCGLPEFLIEAALKAMKQDSQHATDFSQKRLRELMPELPQPTPEFLEEMKIDAAKLGVPPPEMWTDDFRIANSILP